MPNKINIDELKVMIANKIKELKLNDILDNSAIDEVKNRIMNAYKHEQAKKSIPDMIPEATIPNGLGTSEIGVLPGGYGTELATGNTSMQDIMSIENGANINIDQNIDAGTTGNIVSYKPEIPNFLEKIDPAKIIVFSQNELSEGGENLTHKPLRTFEDPDIKKSMNDFWLDKGQKKAEVYMAKLEKIGELEFDYSNGITKFIEKKFDPDFELQAKYKENPYMSNAGPAKPGELDINGQPNNILKQISTSVDLKQTVEDLVMKILRDQLLTNQTRAVNEISPEEPMGYNVSQAIKPMEESFALKMVDLVNEYEKIDMPSTLKEAVDKNDKTFLSKENGEVQEWIYEGKRYYTPVVKISTKKCYIKL